MVLIDGAEVRNMALMCLMEFVVGRGSIYGVWLYIYIYIYIYNSKFFSCFD